MDSMYKLMHKKLNKKGFTILELLVVVAIIAILAVIAVPQFIGNIDKARVSGQIADCSSVSKALVMYNFDNSAFPADDETHGFVSLVTKVDEVNWNGPYIDHVPDKNKWGGEFNYVVLTEKNEAVGLEAGQVVIELTNVPEKQAERMDIEADSGNGADKGVIRYTAADGKATVYYVVK